MNRIRLRESLCATIAVVGVLLSGCGDGTDDGGNADDERQSPLAEYLGTHMVTRGFGRFPGEGSQMSEEERQNFRREQELIAECMQEKGFEYVPRSVDDEDPSGFAADESLTDEEFAEQYGYGFVAGRVSGDGEGTDPNQEIRDDLSGAALDAYMRALRGEVATQSRAPADGDSSPATPGQTDDDRGCMGKAATQVRGDGYSTSSLGAAIDEFPSLFQDLTTLGQRIQNDPEVVAAVDRWANCMADGGFPDFERPAEAMRSVLERASQLTGYSQRASNESDDDGPPSDDATEPPRGLTIGDLNTVDPEKLAELREYEIDVATVDYRCQQEHYLETYREVALQMEREFVEQHREVLESFQDWRAQNDG